MSLLTNFPHTCDVYTRDETTDSASGGQVVNYVLRASDVPCLIKPSASTSNIYYGQQNITTPYTIATTASDWNEGDKIVSNSGVVMYLLGIQPIEAVGTIPDFYMIYAGSIQ